MCVRSRWIGSRRLAGFTAMVDSEARILNELLRKAQELSESDNSTSDDIEDCVNGLKLSKLRHENEMQQSRQLLRMRSLVRDIAKEVRSSLEYSQIFRTAAILLGKALQVDRIRLRKIMNEEYSEVLAEFYAPEAPPIDFSFPQTSGVTQLFKRQLILIPPRHSGLGIHGTWVDDKRRLRAGSCVLHPESLGVEECYDGPLS
mmetsp:Transcript_39337/g.63800  ORF Transcript_39337/g.63800 Transcript_39337/m.63800 type:complete len:202 (-) Transcript_39337:2404-3009(-)